MANYVALQSYFSGRPFTALFGESEIKMISGSFRISEIGFYGPMWMLAQLVPNERMAVALAASFGVYHPTFFGLKLFRKHQQWNEGHFLAVLFFVFFASINFVQTTHLLRRYTFSSMMFLAFALFLFDRRRMSFAVTLLACTVHNGAFLLVVKLVLLALLFPPGIFTSARRGALLLRVAAGGLLMGASFYLGALEQLQSFTSEETNIGATHYLLIGVLFAMYFIARKARQTTDVSRHYVTMAVLAVFSLSLGFFLLGARLFALRYFVYLEWLFGLMIGAILHALPRTRLGVQQFARWALCAASVAIFVLRIQGAPWAYAGERVGIFSRNFFDLVAAVGQ